MADEFDDVEFLAAEAAVQRPTSAPHRTVTTTATTTSRDGGAPTDKVVQPKPQAFPSRQGPSAILVSTRQKGNPILNHVKALPWEYSDIPCDYVVGATTCALFLSLKYHRLHPEYIYSRIRQLGKLYNLRLLLTMVDITNHEEALKELSKTSMINNLTLILCWSSQEAGRYLELFKSYEHASPASIRAHQAETYRESLNEFVTAPRTVNKTDAASLIANFGSLRAAVNAQPEELALVPGWGEKKIRAWSTLVREPFRVRRAAKSSLAVVRHDTTMDADGGDDLRSALQTDHANTPIPISSVPSISRQASGAVASPQSSDRGPSQKRPRLGEVSVDDIDDQVTDEQIDQSHQDDQDDQDDHLDRSTRVALSSTEPEKTTDVVSPPQAPAVRRKEPELSEGIMAALAKLRQNG